MKNNLLELDTSYTTLYNLWKKLGVCTILNSLVEISKFKNPKICTILKNTVETIKQIQNKK